MPQRLPAHVLVRVPAVAGARHAPLGPALGLDRLRVRPLGPLPPGVVLQRVLPVRLELVDQLRAPGRVEARRDADVVQVAAVVVEAEQQRPDALAVLVPPEPGDHDVRGAQVLHLEPAPLAFLVRAGDVLGRSRRRARRPRTSRTTRAALATSRVIGVRWTGGSDFAEHLLELGAALARTASRAGRRRPSRAGRTRRTPPASPRRACSRGSRPGGSAATAGRSRGRPSVLITISPSSTAPSGSDFRSGSMRSGK